MLAIVASSEAARAQELQFRRLTPDDGLASSRIHDMTQDGRGFVWIGTDKGVSKYDGYRFTNFRAVRGDRDSLPHQFVEGLYVDRSGVLWVGSRGGLSRYDESRDAWTTYLRDTADDVTTRRAVIAMLEDRRGNFWVGTSGGLARLDRRTGRIIEELFTPNAEYRGEYVQALHEDDAGMIWIGTLRNGAYAYDPLTRVLRAYRHDPRDPQSIPGNEVKAFVTDAAGTFWIATHEGGLARVDRRSGRLSPFAYTTTGRSDSKPRRINRLLADRDSGLWIGIDEGGLEYLDPRTARAVSFVSQKSEPWSLNSNAVWALHQDRTGALWVGTFAGGVSISKQNGQAIRHFRSIPGVATSLSHDVVRTFAEDRDEVIWVGTDGGGLNRFDRRTGTFTTFTSQNTNLNRDGVLAVAVDSQNAVWIGTWDGGISRFDPVTRRFTTYTSANSDLPENNIFSLHVDRAGRLWAGTLKSGLVEFDPATGRARRHLVPPPGIYTTIRRIDELHDGRLLCALEGGGLVIFDPRTGRSRAYRWTSRDSNSIASNTVFAVHESKPGVVWIGTDAGLDRLDLRTGRFTHLTTRNGLPSDRVLGVVSDTEGALWLSTDLGISRFDTHTRHIDNYATSDGLQGLEFNAGAYVRARDGALLFGGSNGFNLIQPARIVHNTHPPHVVLTGFQLFNRPVRIGAPDSPLTSHITTMRHITLAPDQSVFTLEFAALDFDAPSRNRYSYRLEGFDTEWVRAGTSRTATYTNLPPGDYVFRVRASNADGVWNNLGTSLRITIQPPFWRTWWFATLVVLVVAVALALVARNARQRRRRLEAMNARLEAANVRLAEASERDRASQQYLERNVVEILGAMQRFSAGDHSITLTVTTDDEIGRLRRGFNTVVAERKLTEEALRQSQKLDAVGRLAGGIAHDFNNLLTIITGNIGLALADLSETNPMRADLIDVERAAERAASLTRQLLAFSRKQVLRPRLLVLEEVVTTVGDLLVRTVGEDVRLHFALEASDAHVHADPGQLQQVLLNLALNARDAMPRGGDLWIETRTVIAANALHESPDAAPRPFVALTVRDNGVGIPPAIRERIFDPFFTTKEVGQGTGLGLSTVYGIVAQSGGFMEVESTPGEGSTFRVLLPRVLPALADTQEALTLQHARGSETVLVTEDEEGVRHLVCSVLARAGYTVLHAANGKEAIERARTHSGRIDLLLTDVVMPQMSGRELAERLLPTRAETRVLYMSGYTEDAVLLHGVSTLEAAFLEKPFTANALVSKVRATLDASSSSCEMAVASQLV